MELLALSLVPRHEIHEYLSKNNVCFNTHWKSSMYHSSRCTLNQLRYTDLHSTSLKHQNSMFKIVHAQSSTLTYFFGHSTFLTENIPSQLWRQQMVRKHSYICLHVKVFVILCDFNQNQNVWTNFIKNTKHEILRKSFPWKSPWYM